MMRKNVAVLLVLAAALSSIAEVSLGMVTLPSESSGYIFREDSLITSYDESAHGADITLRGMICTLSCPGSCRYRMAGSVATFIFQVPFDSVNLDLPLDTLDTTILRRTENGYEFDAQSMYGKEENPGITLLVRTEDGTFAVVVVAAVETTPVPTIPIPGDCFAYSLSSASLLWFHQDDRTLRFAISIADKPTVARRYAALRTNRQGLFHAVYSFTDDRRTPSGRTDNAMKAYSLQGRSLGDASRRMASGVYIIGKTGIFDRNYPDESR